MNRYRAYGLAIASAWACPELWPDPAPADPPDLTIAPGPVPASLEGARVRAPKFEAAGDMVLLKTIRIADFLLAGGRTMTFQPKPNAVEGHVVHLMLGWATGVILLQRGAVTLHGSAVVMADGVHVFCGESGAGKSTLACHLAARGHRVLDDNAARLVPMAGGGFAVAPGARRLRLWRDVVEADPDRWAVRMSVPNTDDKFAFDPPPAWFTGDAARLAAIHIMRRGVPAFVHKPVPAGERVGLLWQHLFCLGFLPAIAEAGRIGAGLITVADRVPVRRLDIPPGMAAEAVADRIVASIPSIPEAGARSA